MKAILNLILKSLRKFEYKEIVALHLKRTTLVEVQKIDYSLIKGIKNYEWKQGE